MTSELVEAAQARRARGVRSRGDTLARPSGELDGRSRALAPRRARRRPQQDAAFVLVAGTTVGCSRSRSRPRRRNARPRSHRHARCARAVLVRLGRPAARRAGSRTLASGRRVLELVDRTPAVRDRQLPRLPAPGGAVTVALEERDRSLPGQPARARGIRPRALPDVAWRSSARRRRKNHRDSLLALPRPGRRSRHDRRRDLRELRQEDVRRTFALAGQEATRLRLAVAKPGSRTGRNRGRALPKRSAGRGFATGWTRCPTASRRSSVRRGALSGGQRQRLVVARALCRRAVLLLDGDAQLDPDGRSARDRRAAGGRRPIRAARHPSLKGSTSSTRSSRSDALAVRSRRCRTR